MTSLEGVLFGIGAPYFMVVMSQRWFAIPKQPDILWLFIAGAVRPASRFSSKISVGHSSVPCCRGSTRS
jgi:hypothetical protein